MIEIPPATCFTCHYETGEVVLSNDDTSKSERTNGDVHSFASSTNSLTYLFWRALTYHHAIAPALDLS